MKASAAIFFAGVCFILGVVIGAALEKRILAPQRQISEWSAMKSLHASIVEALEVHKARHGTYPASLIELTLDYDKTDKARPQMLSRFYFHRTGDDYELFWDESIYWGHNRRSKTAGKKF